MWVKLYGPPNELKNILRLVRHQLNTDVVCV